MWVNIKKIAPFILLPFHRNGRNTLFGSQLDGDRLILFFDKNANPPDEIPESLRRCKREDIIIAQIGVPPGKTIDQMIRVFTCKEPTP
jgi:hypothetical protein